MMRKHVLSILFAIVITSLCYVNFIRMSQSNQYINDIRELNSATDTIVGNLSKAFAYADMLDLLIRMDTETFTEDKFIALSDMAIEENTYIDSFQLAPDAVVSYINPIEGNEAAIGHRLLEDESRRDSVLEAIDAGEIVTQGPLYAVQGKVMVFGRKAIMIDGEFWGLAVIAIDFEEFLEKCGLKDNNLGYEYAISVFDSDGNLTYTYGDENIAKNPYAYADVKLPSQSWRISIRHNNAGFSYWLKNYGVFIIASILVGIAAYVTGEHYSHKIYNSKTDSLTKTLLRDEFQRQAEKKLTRRGAKCALISIDLDVFKEINDTYGHMAGDEVLIRTADRIRTVLKRDDLVSRIDDSEYLIFISHIQSQDHAVSILDKIRSLCERDIIFEGKSLNIGISAGYAISKIDGSDYKDMYQTADKRMSDDKALRRVLSR